MNFRNEDIVEFWSSLYTPSGTSDIRHFAMVHDSYGVHACDVDLFRTGIAELPERTEASEPGPGDPRTPSKREPRYP